MRKHRLAGLALLMAAGLLAACSGATMQIGLEPPADDGNAVSPDSTVAPTPVPMESPSDGSDAATGSGPEAAGETTIIPAGWVGSASLTYGITFSHPPGWTLDPAYDERLSGPDGFVQLNALGSPDLTDPLAACQQQADHPLQPFGTDPRIEPITAGGMAGCLITPGGDHADQMGGQQQAILRYPQPITIDGVSYDFLLLDADPINMLPILVSLRFGAAPGSGGSGEHLDGFCCGFPDGGNGPFETVMTTVASVDAAAGSVTFTEASTVGAVGLVDANTALRIADITPNGADATLSNLQPGMSVQAEFLVESGQPPRLQALWVLPAGPIPSVTEKPVELRNAPIRAVDTVNTRFVQEPLGEIILYDKDTVFILDDESLNGTLAGPEILEVGRWAHVTLLQGPDGPVMTFPPEEPLTAVQVIVHQ